jgi:hypothetical protein
MGMEKEGGGKTLGFGRGVFRGGRGGAGIADDVHAAVELSTWFHGDGVGGDVTIEGAVGANDDFAGGVDIAGGAGIDEDFFGVNGVGEVDVSTFFDGEFAAFDGAADGAFGAEFGFVLALDFGIKDPETSEIMTDEVGGCDGADFANGDIAASADGGGDGLIDVEVFATDGGTALGTLSGFGGAADFELVAAFEAFDAFEVELPE